jgi:hypothetical protein
LSLTSEARVLVVCVVTIFVSAVVVLAKLAQPSAGSVYRPPVAAEPMQEAVVRVRGVVVDRLRSPEVYMGRVRIYRGGIDFGHHGVYIPPRGASITLETAE